MRGFQTVLKTGVVSAVAAIGVLATASNASAYIACNRHQCWHARTQYAYPATVGIVVHPDAWRWSGRGYRWARDRDDRGYYNRGTWRRF